MARENCAQDRRGCGVLVLLLERVLRARGLVRAPGAGIHAGDTAQMHTAVTWIVPVALDRRGSSAWQTVVSAQRAQGTEPRCAGKALYSWGGRHDTRPSRWRQGTRGSGFPPEVAAERGIGPRRSRGESPVPAAATPRGRAAGRFRSRSGLTLPRPRLPIIRVPTPPIAP